MSKVFKLTIFSFCFEISLRGLISTDFSDLHYGLGSNSGFLSGLGQKGLLFVVIFPIATQLIVLTLCLLPNLFT